MGRDPCLDLRCRSVRRSFFSADVPGSIKELTSLALPVRSFLRSLRRRACTECDKTGRVGWGASLRSQGRHPRLPTSPTLPTLSDCFQPQPGQPMYFCAGGTSLTPLLHALLRLPSKRVSVDACARHARGPAQARSDPSSPLVNNRAGSTPHHTPKELLGLLGPGLDWAGQKRVASSVCSPRPQTHHPPPRPAHVRSTASSAVLRVNCVPDCHLKVPSRHQGSGLLEHTPRSVNSAVVASREISGALTS